MLGRHALFAHGDYTLVDAARGRCERTGRMAIMGRKLIASRARF
jgi:hypothetical protein